MPLLKRRGEYLPIDRVALSESFRLKVYRERGFKGYGKENNKESCN